MQNPHVKKMMYAYVPNETVSYNNPPPIDDETEQFSMKLDNGEVTFTMKEHFSTVEKAREIVDKYLEVWEIDIGLRFGKDEASFEYQDAEIIDLEPPSKGDTHIIAMTAKATGKGSASVKVHVGRSQYPLPPKKFIATPDVKSMWDRYNMYLEGKETLASMAYFCYTVFVNLSSYGTTKQSSRDLNISKTVLKKLSYLSSCVGDEKTARKGNIKEFRLHTPAEVKWLEETIRTLIRRVGESACIPKDQLKQITMSDLPPIK